MIKSQFQNYKTILTIKKTFYAVYKIEILIKKNPKNLCNLSEKFIFLLNNVFKVTIEKQ